MVLNRKRCMAVLASTAACVLMSATTFALLTDWTIDHLPVVLGEGVTYTAVDDGKDAMVNIAWDYRCMEMGCQQNWSSFGNARSFTTIEGRVGKQDVRVTAAYQPNPYNPPPASNFVIHNITVLPPDAMAITTGLALPCANGPDTIQVEFTVRGGGRDCGAYLSSVATAQEKITNKTFSGPTGVQHLADDLDFSSGAPAFYLSGNKIIDMKNTKVNPTLWASIPVGSVFYTFTQTNRILVKDCCDQAVPPIDVSFNLQRRKVSETDWQLEITP